MPPFGAEPLSALLKFLCGSNYLCVKLVCHDLLVIYLGNDIAVICLKVGKHIESEFSYLLNRHVKQKLVLCTAEDNDLLVH